MPRLAWSRELTRSVVVKHGRPGELKTLADARDLIRSLSARRQQQTAWQHAGELLLRAAGFERATRHSRTRPGSYTARSPAKDGCDRLEQARMSECF
jgi:hypothetical protein